MLIDQHLFRIRIGMFHCYRVKVRSIIKRVNLLVVAIMSILCLISLSNSSCRVIINMARYFLTNIDLFSHILIAISQGDVYFHISICMSLAYVLQVFDRYIFSLISRFLLIISGIEPHPGPSNPNNINYAFWNLDSLLARDGHKKSVIEGLNSISKYDLFGVVETYLNADILDNQLNIKGFAPVPFRADSTKPGRVQGGVCLYYNPDLPIKNRAELVDLEETIVAEVRLKRKKIFILLSYRSPSDNSLQLSSYCTKLQGILDKINEEKPSLIILSGDFNARSPLFWEHDDENAPGKKLSEFMITNGLEQIIKEATHFPRDNIETCLDLVLTDRPNTFLHSGVIPSPDPRCKHHIITTTISFSVPCPPPYYRKIWRYKLASGEDIRNNFRLIDWQHLFHDASVDDMVCIFNSTFLNIMGQYIPNKVIRVDDRDAPWITPEVKTAIRKNHRVYNKWKSRGKPPDSRDNVKKVQKETDEIIGKAKADYVKLLEDKLCTSSSGSNIFWSAVNRLVDNKKNTNIPPLLENDVFVSSFPEKAKIFNEYFAKQCIPLQNDSTLPFFSKRTMSSLANVDVSHKNISSIINRLNANKAHGHDDISVHMLKFVSDEVSVPLKIIFDKCIAEGIFPSVWKKANVQPVHKKNSRQEKTNYRPISLLPICSKIFEKILFDSIYSYLHSNHLLSKNQSGFRPGDSTINQLLAITHDIYVSFEHNCETRSVFLDISKAFDKVWHEGLIFKLASNGIEGNLLNLLRSFLSDRCQRTVLNGTTSDWLPLHSGVPQGSVLGPLLFLVYINDLTDNIKSTMKLFADDSSIFLRVLDVNMCHQIIKADLSTVSNWAFQWKMRFNPDITKQAIEVIFSHKRNKPNHPPLLFNGIPVKRESETQHLGVHLDSKLNFRKHVS